VNASVRLVEELPAAHDAAVEVITQGLIRFNERYLGPRPEPVPFVFTLRDEAGEVVGGVVGDVNRKWCHIDMLWIDDAYRGHGHGTRLMARAEAFARARDCVGMYLDTASFQARPFYESLGFVVFGTHIEKFPGVSMFYMERRLTE
jgi:GNAT superfamily N-acetyltransferase